MKTLVDKLDFLSSIINRKERLKELRYIYSNGQKVLASNGTIFVALDEKLEEGFYFSDTYKHYSLAKYKYPEFKRSLNPEGEPIELKKYKTGHNNYSEYILFYEHKDVKGRDIAVSKKNFDKVKEYEEISKLKRILTYITENMVVITRKTEKERIVIHRLEQGIGQFTPVFFEYEDGTVICVSRYPTDM